MLESFAINKEVSGLIAQMQRPKTTAAPVGFPSNSPITNTDLIQAASQSIEYLDQDLDKRALACFIKMKTLIQTQERDFQSTKEACLIDLEACMKKFTKLSDLKKNLYQSRVLEQPSHSRSTIIRPIDNLTEIGTARQQIIKEGERRVQILKRRMILDNLDFLIDLINSYDNNTIKQTLNTMLNEDYKESQRLCPNLKSLRDKSTKIREYEAFRDRKDSIKDLCTSIGESHHLSLDEVVNLAKNLDQAKSGHPSINELRKLIPEYDELFSNFLMNLESLKNIKGIDRLILDCIKQLDQCGTGDALQPVILGAFAEADFNKKLTDQGFEIKEIGATDIPDKARIIDNMGNDLLTGIDLSNNDVLEQLKEGQLISAQAKISNNSVALDQIDDKLYLNLQNQAINDKPGSLNSGIAVELPNGNYGFYEIDAIAHGKFTRASGETLSGTFYIEHKASPTSFLLKNPINKFLTNSSIVMQSYKMMQVAKSHQVYPVIMSDFDSLYDDGQLKDTSVTQSFARAIQHLGARFQEQPNLIVLNHDGKDLTDDFLRFTVSV